MNHTQALHIEPDGIHVLWGDGHEGHYPHWYLRAACQCVDCLDGAGHNEMWFYESIPHDVQALDWMLVGQYSVQFLRSDGHYTGIYAYDTLRQICRCPVCLARAVTARGLAREGC